jgi:sporulation protein YlmC with PRC-barrel domain
MDLQKDAMIVTHDGQEVGHLDRVAINPRSKEVTHLVVRKGRLFPVDKVIEMSYVDSVTPERIILRPELGDPEYLPPFQVKYYVGTNAPMAPDAGLGRTFAPRGYWTAPAGNIGGLGGVPVRGIPDSALPLPKLPPAGKELEVEQNVPDTTVALKEGAKVVAEDGKAVGQVVRITADETTGTATHFVVTMGTVGKTHKAVPTDWIGDVQEKEVKLLVEADAVEQLSDYEEPSHAPSEPMR